MSKNAVGPLLPDGQRVDQIPGPGKAGYSAGCEIRTGHRYPIAFDRAYVSRPHDPMGKDLAHNFTRRSEMAALPFPGKGALGDKSAMVTAKCGATKAPYLIVNVEVDTHTESNVKKRREDIARFTKALVLSTKKKLGCAA